MPPINILVKPASSACNMHCKYCFYEDEAVNRTKGFAGMMSNETAENMIESAARFASGTCSFMFQGGEPTLAGLDFYRSFLETEKKYLRDDLTFLHSIQTNGYALDDEWINFFKENDFFVGISLDGYADLHDLNRNGKNTGGSFNRVMRSIALLKKYGVRFNVLSVVTSRAARSAEKNYNFFKKQGLDNLQFIPCLDPIGESSGFSPSAEEYASFLTKTFRLWYADFIGGRAVSIRTFDNWLSILLGGTPEACDMCGCCGIQFVVEGDGSVYPCDFYALDEYKIGTVGESSFEEMLASPVAQRFVEVSLNVPEECRQCRWYPLCRNGCRREREVLTDGAYGKTRRCAAYKLFFEANEPLLAQVLRIIKTNRVK